jgi:UDP-glucose:(heptosyl)LPS alpha-1,3-glucosyltransferase
MYIAELAENFSRNHEVHIFAISWTDVRSDRIIFHKVPVFSYLKFFARFPFLKYFERAVLQAEIVTYALYTTVYFFCFGSRFDVIHTNGADSLYSSDVVSAHSIYKAWRDYMVKSGQKKLYSVDPFSVFIEWWLYHIGCAKKIIVDAITGKNELIQYHGTSEDRIIVVPLGSDTNEFKQISKILLSDLVAKYGIEKNETVLFILSTELPRKGVYELIQAFALLKTKHNLKLFIAGEGRPHGPQKYIELAKKLGIHERVIFAGHVTDLNRYYNLGDIFVFPTKYEGFGIPILEAMAVGLPVITSRTGAGELITDGVDGVMLNDQNNPNEIAEKIQMLLNDKSLRERIGINARKTAERYTWAETAKRTMEVYKEIIKEKQYARSRGSK